MPGEGGGKFSIDRLEWGNEYEGTLRTILRGKGVRN